MAYVRGQESIVYEDVVATIKRTLLEDLGWDGTALPGVRRPRGATVPLTFSDRPPDTKDGPLAPNTIAFSSGQTPDEDEGELGASSGGLWLQTHTLFIDVYGENAGMAKRMAGDVRMILTGRVPGLTRVWPVHDLTQTGRPVLAGHAVTFEDVEVDFPAAGTIARTHWVVVKATIIHSFSG